MDTIKGYSIKVNDVVTAVEFSPFGWFSSLLAVGTATNIIIISCKFQEDDTSVEDMEYEEIRKFHYGNYVSGIAWSPQTTLLQIPNVLRFSTIGGDKKLRVFYSDLKNTDSVQTFEGHTDYINHVCFEPRSGEELASVSDDHTCRVWNIDGTLKAKFSLNSPGMFVSWHPDESPEKILVAEKKGVIRFYNVLKQQPLMSFDCSLVPLMSADWCLFNSLQVGCVAASDLLLWNISVSSQPVERKPAHSGGALCFRFCRTVQNLMASRGRPGSEIKVVNSLLNQTLITENVSAGQGLSWHFKIPVLAAGGDGKVHLWKIDTV